MRIVVVCCDAEDRAVGYEYIFTPSNPANLGLHVVVKWRRRRRMSKGGWYMIVVMGDSFLIMRLD
jgi:hypothetical protein